MYTGQIKFANLGSQDVTPSEKEAQVGCPQGEGTSPQDSGGPIAPPLGAVVVEPCSPKSAYCLANKVSLTPLRSDAVIDNPFA